MSRDPFEQDRQQRARLADEVQSVRLALFEAHEAQDGAAALAALKRMYVLVDRFDAQVLHFEHSTAGGAPAFTMPVTCQQRTALFDGTCRECGGRIHRGQIMYWDRQDRASYCVTCCGIPGLAPQPDGRAMR